VVVLLGTFGVVPGGAELFGILRLLRLFTALSFLTDKLPALRMVVATASRATSSIAYVGLLLLAVYFQFGMIACVAFSQNDSWNFGTIHLSMLSLFRVSILDGWIELMYINMLGCDQFGYAGRPEREHMCFTGAGGVADKTDTAAQPWGIFAPLFFMSFVIIATFIFVNLFVGVVTTSMEDAHAEIEEEQVRYVNVW
jgi:voltage-gated sodium channel